MTCNFSLLQNRAHFLDEQLNRIDIDLMQAKKILVDIDEPRRLCLQELGLRRLFVKWVKDALEGTCRCYRLCFHPQIFFSSKTFRLVSVVRASSVKNGVFPFRHQ